jgi:hypothetical protein
MHLNIIWGQSPHLLTERDWIRWLFRNFATTEYVAPDLDVFINEAIYIISTNHHPFYRISDRVQQGLARTQRKGLFHISDESYSGGYGFYKNFDLVIRNYHSSFFQNRGIKILPLGFTNDLPNNQEIPPAPKRRLAWSFAGARTAARMEMYRNFKSLQPHQSLFFDSRKHNTPPLDRQAFMRLLSETVFAPCPMGNVMLETFRLYEALEMGCIPIVETRSWMPYYDRLMPGHPLPTFSSWRKARCFAESILKNEHSLIESQSTIAQWWVEYKENLRHELTSFVSAGFEGAFQSSLMVNWDPLGGVPYQLRRILELLRHGSRASLEERMGITIRQLSSRLARCRSKAQN